MVRSINIVPVMNGFVVQAGCQTVVFDNIEVMTKSIAAYYRDPENIERYWVEHALNKTMDGPSPIRRVVESQDRERRSYNPSGLGAGPVCSPAPQESTGECCAEPVPRNPPSIR